MAKPEQMSLDAILDDKTPEKPEAPAAETPKEGEAVEKQKQDYEGLRQQHRRKEYAAQGRDPETGQFIPKDEPKEPKDGVQGKTEEKVAPKEAPKEEQKAEAKPPAQEFTDKERAFLKGLEEERKKRQAMERELAELRQKVPQAPAEQVKGFWDDPEAALKKHQQEMSNLATQTRLQTAEVIARSKYQDFDEKIDVFKEVLQQTPGLHAQWLAAPDPADFAYKTGKYHKELQDAGSLDALRQKIEKETRIKIEAELKDKAERLQKERDSIPPSLSDVRGTSTPQNRPAWTGPTPLEDILKG